MSQLSQWLNPRSSAAKMAVLFILASIPFYAAYNTVAPWVALIPGDVVHQFKLWQLVTYVCIFQKSPGSFIFGALILVSIGGALERQWGVARLWIFSFVITMLAGVVCIGLSFLLPPLADVPFVGADAVYQSQWVAYGLLIGKGRSNFWGILPVTGYTLALIGAGFVLLNGLLGNWLAVLPEVIAIALTFVHIYWKFPQDQLQRFGSWRLQRDLQKRSSHLRVISGDQRNTSRDSDKFLH